MKILLNVKIKTCLYLHSRTLFYNACILTQPGYCNTMGKLLFKTRNNSIEFLKRSARIMLDKPHDASSSKQLRWKSFPERLICKSGVKNSLQKRVQIYIFRVHNLHIQNLKFRMTCLFRLAKTAG